MVVTTILGEWQRKALNLFKKTELAKHFYLAGGTALSEFYLQHRKSEDLDFFTQDELDLASLKKFSQKVQLIMPLDKIEFQHGFGLYTFFFYPKDEVVKYKIDFGQYPFELIKPVKNIDRLRVESILDIAVDKIHTISVRPRSRDFVDLYFILQAKPQWKFADLLKQSFEKFEMRVDQLQLGENLLQVEHLEDMPIMLKDLEIKKMRQWFLNEAKKFKKEVFK